MSDIPMWPEIKIEKVTTPPAGLPNFFPAGYMAWTRTEGNDKPLSAFVPSILDRHGPVDADAWAEVMLREGLTKGIADEVA